MLERMLLLVRVLVQESGGLVGLKSALVQAGRLRLHVRDGSLMTSTMHLICLVTHVL